MNGIILVSMWALIGLKSMKVEDVAEVEDEPISSR